MKGELINSSSYHPFILPSKCPNTLPNIQSTSWTSLQATLILSSLMDDMFPILLLLLPPSTFLLVHNT